MYITKYFGLCQLMWSKVLEHKINKQLFEIWHVFLMSSLLSWANFLSFSCYFCIFLGKNLLLYKFLISFTESRRSFSKKIYLSDAKLTFKEYFWQKLDGVLLSDCRCGLVTVGGCLVTASPIPLLHHRLPFVSFCLWEEWVNHILHNMILF